MASYVGRSPAGRTRLRPTGFSDIGQFDLGQSASIQLTPEKILWTLLFPGWGPEGWGPEGWGPKISHFFPSPATIFFLSSLSEDSFRGILVVFLKRRGPALQKHHQNSTKGILREREKKERKNGGGRKKKRAKFLAVRRRRSGGGGEGRRSTQILDQTHTHTRHTHSRHTHSRHTHSTHTADTHKHTHTQNRRFGPIGLRRIGLSRPKKKWTPKTGLSRIGLSRIVLSRTGLSRPSSGHPSWNQEQFVVRWQARSLFPSREAVQGGALRTRTCSREGSRQVAGRSWSRGRVVCSSNKPENDVAF